jgi:hypothetical protein
MDELTCCKDSSWELERDLASAGGFEFVLGRCGHCGTSWMNVLCVATGVTGHEPVKPGDVEAIRAIADGSPELKQYMRRWGNANL